jgi:hypothetical protein
MFAGAVTAGPEPFRLLASDLSCSWLGRFRLTASYFSCVPKWEGRFRLLASDFLLLRQKKVTKEKATPEVTVSVLRTETSLRCSSALAAAELALFEGSDSPRRNPSAACASRRPQLGPAPIPCMEILPSSMASQYLSDFQYGKTDTGVQSVGTFPGPRVRRRAAQQAPGFRRGLSERARASGGASSAAAGACEQRRAVAAGDRCFGVCFSLVTLFCTSKRE